MRIMGKSNGRGIVAFRAIENKDDMSDLKRKMTLDFNCSSSKRQKVTNLLTSPDLNMLKLESPELEKMIIAQHGMITTTPTPTQFVFPRTVTEEQEMYAQGFVEALANLKKQEPPYDMPVSTAAVSTPSFTELTSMMAPPPVITVTPATTATTSLPGKTLAAPMSAITLPVSRVQHIKQEQPQTVPCLNGTPPMSPVDMEHQEVIKLERKRERNRIAASKCRLRKLERISQLEGKVAEIKSNNASLSQTASELREQVCLLKRQLLEHMNSGCKLVIPPEVGL